jgi:glucans biosynthesis protein C
VGNNRYYYIDSLRNFANIIRCFIHAAVPYMVTFSAIWPVDDGGSYFFDVAIFGGHLFVMELYFVIAGFLFAHSLKSKSVNEIITDRIQKIFIPFVLVLVIIMPVVLSFFKLANYSDLNQLNANLIIQIYLDAWKLGLSNFFPTGHVWFLYYLLLFYVITLIFRSLFGNKYSFQSGTSFKLILISGVLVSSLLMFTLKRWMIENPLTLTVELPSFIHFYMFFGVGILIHNSERLQSYMYANAQKIIIMGIVGFVLAVSIQPLYNYNYLTGYNYIRILAILFYAIGSWALTLGIWSYFFRWQNNYNSKISYLSDASYWIYLINILITMTLHLLLKNLDISIYLKFLITFVGAFLLSLATYEYMVRYTSIGAFLSKSRKRK